MIAFLYPPIFLKMAKYSKNHLTKKTMVSWINILLDEFRCDVEKFLKNSTFSYNFLKKNSWRITDNKISLVTWLELCDPLSFLVLEEILKTRSFEVSEELKKKIEQVNWELIIQSFSIPFLKGKLTNILIDILSVEKKQHSLKFVENFRENYKKASPSFIILNDLIQRKEKKESWEPDSEQKVNLEKDVQEQKKQGEVFFRKEENNISKILKNYLFERKENIEKIKEDLYQKWNKEDTNSIISFLGWMEKQSFSPYSKRKKEDITRADFPNHNLFSFEIEKELRNFAYEEVEYVFHRKKTKVWPQYVINHHDLSELYNSIFLPELSELCNHRFSSFLGKVKCLVKTLEKSDLVIKLEKEELCSDSNCLSWWIFFHHPLSLLALEEVFIERNNLDALVMETICAECRDFALEERDFSSKCEHSGGWFSLIEGLLIIFWETKFVQALLGIDNERIEMRNSLQNQTSSENETTQIDYRNIFQTNYSNLILSLKENETCGRETRVMTTFFREEENIVLSVIENWVSEFEENTEVNKKNIKNQFVLKWRKVMESEKSPSLRLLIEFLFANFIDARDPFGRTPRFPVYMRTKGIKRLLEKKVEETFTFYKKNSKFKQENRAVRLTGKSLVAKKVITNPDSVGKTKINIPLMFLIIVPLLVLAGALVFLLKKKKVNYRM